MQCQITTLADSTASVPYAIGEWGFSALIETDEMKVLLDSGVGHGAVHNADLLHVDLTAVDRIVLSHSHYDHTQGLPRVLKRIGKEIEVIAGPGLWTDEKYFVGGRRQQTRYTGIPYTRSYLESLGARFTLTQDPVELTGRITTTGEIPMVTDFEKVREAYLLHKVGDRLEMDDFPDERALVVKTHRGLVVALGCGHRCLINTLYHARSLTGIETVHMVIGGCHLVHASEERIRKTIDALRDFDVQRVGVSHSTGLRAEAIMAAELGDRFFFNMAGTRLRVE